MTGNFFVIILKALLFLSCIFTTSIAQYDFGLGVNPSDITLLNMTFETVEGVAQALYWNGNTTILIRQPDLLVDILNQAKYSCTMHVPIPEKASPSLAGQVSAGVKSLFLAFATAFTFKAIITLTPTLIKFIAGYSIIERYNFIQPCIIYITTSRPYIWFVNTQYFIDCQELTQQIWVGALGGMASGSWAYLAGAG